MNFKLFRCEQCGFEYDEAQGWPEDGIEPGTHVTIREDQP